VPSNQFESRILPLGSGIVINVVAVGNRYRDPFRTGRSFQTAWGTNEQSSSDSCKLSTVWTSAIASPNSTNRRDGNSAEERRERQKHVDSDCEEQHRRHQDCNSGNQKDQPLTSAPRLWVARFLGWRVAVVSR